MTINWRYPPIFAADFKSTYKSLWLGWWLVTWCDDLGTGRPTDFCVSFQPGL